MTDASRDFAFDQDCRVLMDALPTIAAGRGMEPGRTFTWGKLSQRAVDVIYLALAHSLAEGTEAAEPAPPVSDEKLSGMLGPALAATLRLAFKEE